MNPSSQSMVVQVRRGSYRHTVSLQCTLCRYQFRSPKILPCYHSFCEACLYAVVATSATKTDTGTKIFNCPTCQAKAEIQKGGVHTLETNFVLAAQVIRLSKNTTKPECSVCRTIKRKGQEEPLMAAVKCWECDKFLCPRCMEVHKNLLKFHTLIQFSQTGPLKVVRYSYCPKHPDEQFRFYCKKCEETICRDCRLTEHAEGHKTVDLAALQAGARELVSKTNEVIVENFLPMLNINTKFFKQEYEEKKALLPGYLAAIEERKQTLMKIVLDAANEALRQVNEVINKIGEESRKYEDNLSRMSAEMEYNELVIQSGSEADVMQAAINAIAYSKKNSPKAGLVAVISQKQELFWERSETLPMPRYSNSISIDEWKSYADTYLGRIDIKRIKLTRSLSQSSEESNITKCFRKIGLLADSYRQLY